ncbi:MAG: ATP-binding cassette domain-containing protein [Agathobacter sp.]|nr:ATP-binding cassette domain-containing protein [Agathobacter sp.]
MLEALHLTKIYKTKGGADVKALDDVSIVFPEKGMVFLLGKSGSGKSTLLNVCGGLDAPTSGAILVKGKSSEKFSQSDFDSYRNTYVGFIFQEYNILNEFTVEDNIALALELQGKPKDKKVIADLLEQVDLTGFAKRKPNTLSGGQKQRIAIARALVKSPEIIMADEPTGALDSATGKQVFDTLKKLSKEKLVIVVSHDRDFAEMYGDRIIELKDGKILSDVTKTQEQQQALTENISIVGDTLCVKNGADLNDADFAEIKAFLSKTDKDVIIAAGERDVKAFKEVSHIKDNGEKEVFKNSEELPFEKKEYNPKDSKFIRSKLPLRHAVRIGVSSLKTKPIRLAFTILLCTVAFTFFGLLSTMTFYDSEATFKQSVQDSNYDMIKLGKVYSITEKTSFDGIEDEYEFSMETPLTEEELVKYAKIFGANAFGGVSSWSSYNVQSNAIQYWVNSISSFAYLQEGNVLRQQINGRYPEKDDEICISSYSAEVLFNCKAYDVSTGKILELSSPESLLGKKVTIDGDQYTVVGIIDSGEIPEKYEALKESDGTDYQLYSSFQFELQDGLHLIAFVTKDCMLAKSEENYFSSMDEFTNQRMVVTMDFGTGNNYVFPEWANAGYGGFEDNVTADKISWLVSGKTELAANEVILSRAQFYSLVSELYSKEANAAMEEGDEARAEQANKIQNLTIQLMTGGIDVENKQTNKWEFHEFTEEETEQKYKELLTEIQKDGKVLTLAVKLFNDWDGVQMGEVKEFAVAGVWNTTKGEDSDKILFSNAVAEGFWENQKEGMSFYSEYSTDYVVPENALYGSIFLPYDHSDEQTEILWDIYQNQEYGKDGSKNILTSTLISNLEMVDSMIQELSKVFLYVGIVLAVFAALLLSNFISISISYKKQEIGILRAVGARSLDVFKIFFSESFVIAAICVAISTIASITLCATINELLISLISASLLVFGITSLLVLIAVALVTVIVATFLPVWSAAKKKPVESIRAL